MTSNDKPGGQAPRDMDAQAKAELKGVPEEMIDAENGAGEADVDEALDLLRGDLEKVKQDVLYAQAETQNVRRRLEKDVKDARTYAATGFARDILSVADNLERALDHVPEALREDAKAKQFIEGIEATRREIDKVFEQHGIKRIASIGLPLDPNQHQAMIEVPCEDQDPGTIVQEMQSGWMIRDRLLRPAMVGVAKKPD